MSKAAINPALRRLAKTLPAQNSVPTVLTIGHSTRSLEEFIRVLQAHGVTRVVDVRTVPRSRHNPQFNREALPASLKKVGIGYTHLAKLGGLRRMTRDSVNGGWRNASFRGYADYMQTPEFQEGLARVIQLSQQDRLALMCAEAVPWRCHRSLIEDALSVRGIPSEDIMTATLRRPHVLTSFAKVRGTRIIYPAVAPPISHAAAKLTADGAKVTRARSVAGTTPRVRVRRKSPS